MKSKKKEPGFETYSKTYSQFITEVATVIISMAKESAGGEIEVCDLLVEITDDIDQKIQELLKSEG